MRFKAFLALGNSQAIGPGAKQNQELPLKCITDMFYLAKKQKFFSKKSLFQAIRQYIFMKRIPSMICIVLDRCIGYVLA